MRRLLRACINGPAVLVIAMTFNNVGIFGFHMIVSRILGPARYGALGALLALTLLLSVATSAVTIAVVRQVAAHPATHWDARGPARALAVVVATLVVIGSALSPNLAHFLHLGSPVPVLLLIVYSAVVLSQVIARGIVLGSHRYRLAAAAIACGTLVRLALGAALASTFGTSGAITAYAVAEGTTAVVLILAAHRHGAHVTPAPLSVPLRTLGLTVAAYGGIWLLAGTDQLLSRHFLGAVDAGIYVAASTAGSIALWLPYNVTSSLFPRLVAEAAASGPSRSFFVGASVAGAITAGASAVMMVIPGFIVAVLFGHSYRRSATVLILLAVSNGLQGMAGFFLHHQLAYQRRSSLLPWLAVLSLAVAIQVHHPGPRGIATDAVLVSAVLTAAMLIVSLRIARRPAGKYRKRFLRSRRNPVTRPRLAAFPASV